MCHKFNDEFNFLLESPRYHDIRRQYLPTYFRVIPSMFKCIELLNTNNDKTVRSLAKYAFEAFRLRNLSEIAKFMGPTWGPAGSCRPQLGPMLAHELGCQGYVSLYVYVSCVMPLLRGGVVVVTARRSPAAPVEVFATVDGGRRWSARPHPSVSVPRLSVFCVICHHVGLIHIILSCV